MLKHSYQINSLFLLLLIFFTACKEAPKNSSNLNSEEVETTDKNTSVNVEYAQGFSISKNENFTTVEVTSPWPNANKAYTYALVPKEKLNSITFDANAYDAIIATPVTRLVATSTTHIPAIELLNIENTLIGFPGTNYISSEPIRNKIDNGSVKELGLNEAINTEVLISLEPELVMGFTVDGENKTYKNIANAGIPVVYNGDWVEETPLGKAEWIKLFGVFFNKEKQADSIFNEIATAYNNAKKLALQTEVQPTVFSGSMFKDIWYAPAGESWVAHFLKDANANYTWKNSKGTGSLSLNFESVLEKAKTTEYWIGPGQFTSYNQLKETNTHYTQFDTFKNKKIFTYSLTTGATGGLLYYELAPNRPDLVLKDIIKILHPNVLPNYEPVFFKPLQP
ncbi:ABC transporter substrate-binding protein [Joostella sp. CR20]|uniref:ABC transporter substrate-binding protein n=1 Tax=Joostella sp. CR20 TaxID=2804312 RepID=UPI00313C0734